MPVAIKNLSSGPIFVSLNSGTNLRLSSGEVAAPVLDVEIMNNSKIDKLVSQRAISVEDLAGAAETSTAETSAADTPGRARKKA